MEIGHRTIGALLERMQDHSSDFASEYGEPGYGSANTAGVFLGYYWCRCDAVREHYVDGRWTRLEDGETPRGEVRNDLHTLEHHYPRLFAALEDQGYELEWSDEWYVDHETGKAWRTTGDSYSWQPSIVWDGWGDYLTPDHGIDAWVEWALEEPTARCIPSRVWSATDLEEAGFVQWEPDDPHTYENGWHPGQTDDPAAIVTEIHEQAGDDVQVVFLLDSTGQFDIHFSAWTRDASTDEDD